VARIERTPEDEKGYQGVISYAHEGLTVALAVEEMDDVNDTYGVAVTYTHGPWYGALKYERHDNDADDDIANFFISYAADKFTYKAMVADGDLWGKEYTTAHAGVDYQFNEVVKIFIELFYESNAYAILDENAKSASEYLGVTGGTWSGPDTETDGTSLAVGVRYDF
jgi:predicted porin